MAAYTHSNYRKGHDLAGVLTLAMSVCRCRKGSACLPCCSLHLLLIPLPVKVGCFNELQCSLLQDRKEKDSFFNWFYFAINFGSLLAVTTLVYIQVSVHAGHTGRLRLHQRSCVTSAAHWPDA